MLSGLKHTPSLIIAPVSPSSSPLLPSANTSQGEQFQVLQNTWRCRGRGGWIKSKRHATKSVHATSSGHKRASESSGGQRLRVFLAQGGHIFFFTRVCCSSSHTYCNVWSGVPTFLCQAPVSFCEDTFLLCVQLKLYICVTLCIDLCALSVCSALTKKTASGVHKEPLANTCRHTHKHIHPHFSHNVTSQTLW